MSNDTVTLLINGQAHDDWDNYRIDSNLLAPADDFALSCSLGQSDTLPEFVVEGATVRVQVNDDVILDGILEGIEQSTTKGNTWLELYGRDRASLLLDCSVPMMSMQKATLADIIKKAVAPFAIKEVVYQSPPENPRLTVHTEPGQTVWEWLQAACEANQVWPWMAPDGKLIIGKPDYTARPVGTLILRKSGDQNNVLSLTRTRSLHQVYSEVTVLGQSQGEGDVGQHDLHGSAKDPSVPIYRPKVVVDGNCESNDLAVARAKKIIADGKMERDKLRITVEGHRIDEAGLLWTPGQRVNIISEPDNINAVYYLMQRTFMLNRTDGPTTELHFVPDGAWLLNLGFVKDKRRGSAGTRRGRYADSDDADVESE